MLNAFQPYGACLRAVFHCYSYHSCFQPLKNSEEINQGYKKKVKETLGPYIHVIHCHYHLTQQQKIKIINNNNNIINNNYYYNNNNNNN